MHFSGHRTPYHVASLIRIGAQGVCLVLLLGLSPAALLRPVAAAEKAAEGPRRPNILFIAIDDLNDWLGCLGGHPQAQTPHIDALARRGTCFTNAHCQAPLCNPSRTSVLTGLRPTTTGVYALQPWFRTGEKFRDHVTLPQHLAANGYRTLTTGKVYHDAYPPAASRTDGSEVQVWGYHGSFGPRPAKKFVQTPDSNPLIDWGVYPEKDELQDDWKVADWAIEQLRSPPTQPFFLGVGLRHPHVPCYASQKWFDLYPAESLKMPPVLREDRDDTPRFSWYTHWKLPEPRLAWLEEAGQWHPLVRAYLASVSFVDSQVGRVLAALAKSGLERNTIVVLWSDHGWHVGEKAITGKNTLWDRSTRVPLIFAGPGVAAGAKCAQPAELLDMYPTLLDLCGLSPRKDLDGHSLAPQLADAQAQRPWPAITSQGPGCHAVRTERWRYIRYADGSQELYDLAADPNEWHNLAGDPQYAAAIAEYARWLPQTSAAPLPGSTSRLLEIKDGTVYWENKPIGPHDPIPQ